jgi:hypothetical protein
MTATPIAPWMTQNGAMLAEVLAPLHEHWFAALQDAVDPALQRTATTWDRWTAARYIGDQVAERLEQERRVIELMPRLSFSARGQIERGFRTLERVRREIERAGREQRADGLLDHLLARFVELLADWYAAIELATAWVPVDTLPAEALEILTGLELETRTSAAV